MTDDKYSFSNLIDRIQAYDSVSWCEKYLTLDGKPFRVNGNGYKPFADIYRAISLKALEPNALPIVITKGRQVGATTMASALEMYFAGCGLYGSNNTSPMRVIHAFPDIAKAASFSKSKLGAMISSSISVDENVHSSKKIKSYMQSLIDTSSPANDNQQFKQFIGGNTIIVESVGLEAGRLRGKQLSLDTELPTPTGFAKLSDLKEGDELFDEQGNICNITKLHPINLSPEAYRIIFDDGTIVDACSEHLWETFTKKNRTAFVNFQNKNSNRPPVIKIKTTKEIFDTLKVGGKKENNHSIQNCKPLNYKEKELDLDPYLLGLWLGGDKIKAADKIISKYIPDEYLYSSYNQRLNLVQGLMDSNGYCDKSGRVRFCSIIPELAFNVHQLLLSLGIKAHINENSGWLYGKKCKNRFRINFVTRLPVFRLERKLKNIKTNLKAILMTTHRYMVDIKKIPSIPMRCITVNSPSHLYLITRSFIPTHNTSDALFLDEVQDMPRAAIANATKVLIKSQYGPRGEGIQVYFGTPKNKGSAFSEMWNNSSQQYYYLHCGKCKDYFPLYTPGSNDWEDIWIHGFIVRCSHCGFEQNKLDAAERGKWVATKPLSECKMIGYHINMLYMPEFSKEKVISEKPENSAVNTERAYQNEVLGEFYSGDTGTISLDQIRTVCGDPERKFRASSHEPDVLTFLGIDIGEKNDFEQLVDSKRVKGQGQSYSVAVVIQMTGPTRMSIILAKKFPKNDLGYKKGLITEIMRQYSINLGVIDLGYTRDLSEILQTEFGDKMLCSAVSGKVNDHVKFNDQVFPKVIQFEKDYWIADLYEQMKKGSVRFPLGDYDQIYWLMEHCASMEIKPSISRTGDVQPHYVKGNQPNDGFMALLNAYIAYRFYVSNGFKIKNPLLATNEEYKEKPLISLGYVPKLR